MTKEMSDKDRSLKTQMLLSADAAVNSIPEKTSGERFWKRNGYFSDEKADFNIKKWNFPENILCYINQGYISTVKGRELAIYNHNHILGQLAIAANQPKDIDQHMLAKNEVKLTVYLYDKVTGEFGGIVMQLAYISYMVMTRNVFFSYGYSEKKSKVLYSVAKEWIVMPSSPPVNVIMRLWMNGITMRNSLSYSSTCHQ